MSEYTVSQQKKEIKRMDDDTFRRIVIGLLGDIMTVVDKGTDAEIRRSQDGTYKVYELKRSLVKQNNSSVCG